MAKVGTTSLSRTACKKFNKFTMLFLLCPQFLRVQVKAVWTSERTAYFSCPPPPHLSSAKSASCLKVIKRMLAYHLVALAIWDSLVWEECIPAPQSHFVPLQSFVASPPSHPPTPSPASLNSLWKCYKTMSESHSYFGFWRAVLSNVSSLHRMICDHLRNASSDVLTIMGCRCSSSACSRQWLSGWKQHPPIASEWVFPSWPTPLPSNEFRDSNKDCNSRIFSRAAIQGFSQKSQIKDSRKSPIKGLQQKLKGVGWLRLFLLNSKSTVSG